MTLCNRWSWIHWGSSSGSWWVTSLPPFSLSPTLPGAIYMTIPWLRASSWQINLTLRYHSRTSTTTVEGCIRPSMATFVLTVDLRCPLGITLAQMPSYLPWKSALCGHKSCHLRPKSGVRSESSFWLADKTLFDRISLAFDGNDVRALWLRASGVWPYLSRAPPSCLWIWACHKAHYYCRFSTYSTMQTC